MATHDIIDLTTNPDLVSNDIADYTDSFPPNPAAMLDLTVDLTDPSLHNVFHDKGSRSPRYEDLDEDQKAKELFLRQVTVSQWARACRTSKANAIAVMKSMEDDCDDTAVKRLTDIPEPETPRKVKVEVTVELDKRREKVNAQSKAKRQREKGTGRARRQPGSILALKAPVKSKAKYIGREARMLGYSYFL